MAQTILGCHLHDKPNFMALGWLSRVNAKPAMLGVGVNKGNQTHNAIAASGEFSVNFPSVDMVAVTDYTGLVSGKRVDKSGLFDLFYGDLQAAPMIKELMGFVRGGKITSMLSKLVSLEDIPHALTDLSRRHVRGKSVARLDS